MSGKGDGAKPFGNRTNTIGAKLRSRSRRRRKADPFVESEPRPKRPSVHPEPEESVSRTLTADDPNGGNAVHFSLDGRSLHKESDEFKELQKTAPEQLKSVAEIKSELPRKVSVAAPKKPSTAVVQLETDRSETAPELPAAPSATESTVSEPRASESNSAEVKKMILVGNKFQKNRKYKKAIEAYSAALRLSPDKRLSSHCYVNRSVSLLSLKRRMEALDDVRQAVALQPGWGAARARLGQALFHAGQYRGAAASFEKALTLDLSDKNKELVREHLVKTRAKLAQKDKAKAQRRSAAPAVQPSANSDLSELQPSAVAAAAELQPSAVAELQPSAAAEPLKLNSELLEPVAEPANSEARKAALEAVVAEATSTYDLTRSSEYNQAKAAKVANAAAELAALKDAETAEADASRSVGVKTVGEDPPSVEQNEGDGWMSTGLKADDVHDCDGGCGKNASRLYSNGWDERKLCESCADHDFRVPGADEPTQEDMEEALVLSDGPTVKPGQHAPSAEEQEAGYAPSDWKANSKYHPVNVAIWTLWLQFAASVASIPTIDGTAAVLFPPALNWNLPLGAPIVLLILHYCPTVVAQFCRLGKPNGRHPSSALNRNGMLISATWQFLLLSLGVAYWFTVRLNTSPVVFPYGGSPLDVYSPENYAKVMAAYRKFLLAVFEELSESDKMVFCSSGAMTRFRKDVLGIKGGKKGDAEFKKRFFDKFGDLLFSLASAKLVRGCKPAFEHPEIFVNERLSNFRGKGFEKMCTNHDSRYGLVRVFLVQRLGAFISDIAGMSTVCTAATDIFNEVKDSPAHQLRLLAQEQNYERIRKLVREKKHLFQQRWFIEKNRARQDELVERLEHVFLSAEHSEQVGLRNSALAEVGEHPAQLAAAAGEHNWQRPEHGEQVGLRMSALASVGEHPAQLAAAAGEHLFQSKEHREQASLFQRTLVELKEHIFQQPCFIDENRARQNALVARLEHIFQSEEHRKQASLYQLALSAVGEHNSQIRHRECNDRLSIEVVSTCNHAIEVQCPVEKCGHIMKTTGTVLSEVANEGLTYAVRGSTIIISGCRMVDGHYEKGGHLRTLSGAGDRIAEIQEYQSAHFDGKQSGAKLIRKAKNKPGGGPVHIRKSCGAHAKILGSIWVETATIPSRLAVVPQCPVCCKQYRDASNRNQSTKGLGRPMMKVVNQAESHLVVTRNSLQARERRRSSD